jgi:hypothetical protein
MLGSEHDQVAADLGCVDSDDARPVAHGDAPRGAGTSTSGSYEGDSTRDRRHRRTDDGELSGGFCLELNAARVRTSAGVLRQERARVG